MLLVALDSTPMEKQLSYKGFTTFRNSGIALDFRNYFKVHVCFVEVTYAFITCTQLAHAVSVPDSTILQELLIACRLCTPHIAGQAVYM